MLTFDNSDSFEEVYVSWYLEALKTNGFIDEVVYHPSPIVLFPAVSIQYNLHSPKRDKVRNFNLIHDKTYTMDFVVTWKSGLGMFHIPIDEEYMKNASFNSNPRNIPFFSHLTNGKFISYIDVKGTGSPHGNKSDMIFSIIQKIVYDKFHIFINKVVPQKLFSETFSPDRYFFTDKSTKPRKINFPTRTLHEFIGTASNIVVHDKDYKNSDKSQWGENLSDNSHVPIIDTGRSPGGKKEKGRTDVIEFI